MAAAAGEKLGDYLVAANGNSIGTTPQAKDDAFAATEGTSVRLDVMANDLGGNAKTLYSVNQGQPSQAASTATTALNGTVSIVDGKILYVASSAAIDALGAGETRTDTFTYTIQLGNGALSVATVTVTLTGTNDGPTITSATATGQVTEIADGAAGENTSALATSGSIAFADLDVNDTHSATFTPGAASYVGTFSLGAVDQSGNTVGWSFSVPDAALDALAAGETRVQTYTVEVADSQGGKATQVVTVTLTGTNDAPVVSGAVTGSAAEGAAAVTLNGLANASDVDHGAVLSVVNVPATLPAGVSFDAQTNRFTLDPTNAAYNHLGLGDTVTVTVNYGVSDGQVVTGAQVSWTITGTNDGPVATADAFTVSENGLAALNLLANDTDADDGAVLSLANVSLAQGQGQVSIVDNRLQFAPGAAYDHLGRGQTATVLVDYTVADQHGATATSQATLTIVGANDAPVVSGPVTATVTEGPGSHTVNALANASDVDDGDVLSLVGVPTQLPAGVTYDAAAKTFTLDANHPAYNSLQVGQTRVVTVTYGVSDGELSRAGSVSWTITGTNDAPQVFGEINLNVFEGGGNPIVNGVGANDPEGDPLSVVLGQLPAGVSFDPATKLFTFNASDPAYNHLAAGATQTVQLTWGISDGQLVTPQTATFIVHGTNDAPVVSSAVSTTAAEGSGIHVLDALANASDVDDGAVLSVIDVPANLPPGVTWDAATHSFSLDANHLAYNSLKAGQSTTVIVNYSVTDGNASYGTSARWTVTGTNDAPVVTALNYGTIQEGQTLSIGAFGGVQDPDGDALTATVGVLPAGATFNSQTNIITFNAAHAAYNHLAAGATQTVTLEWDVTDGAATSHVSRTVTVVGVNDPASFAGQSTGTVKEDTTQTASGQLSVVDPDDNQSSFNAATVNGTYGSLTINTAGAWTYTLNNSSAAVQALNTGQTVNDVLTVTSLDGTQKVISVAVQGLNEPAAGNHIATFDDVYQVPAGYGGFNWVGTGSAYTSNGSHVTFYGSDWHQNGGDNEAYNGYGPKVMTVTRTDGSDFDLVSVEMADGAFFNYYDDAQEVDIIGYDNGVEKYRRHVVLSDTELENIVLNFNDVDKVQIVITNGIYDQGTGWYVIDNWVTNY
ncbi:VCBS domain-containing protein [Phenylobacterium sp.]|uniref:VCBS domain-containing protein n=1 Tax=Phenylobacterium sp. TaxID=1871053 RepID=UPI002F9294B7